VTQVRDSSATPIAVVGMACRLPGGINSTHQLWEALLRGDDLVTEIPGDRWDADELYDRESGVPGRSVSKWGAFLDDVTGFDPDFFGINEREAIAMDPQHRVLLETCWEAVEQAGRTPASMSGTSTGVFIGMSHDDYAMVTSDAGAFDQAYAFTGNPFSMASGRIAHALGLHGPALTIDTACSSSMVAVHQACRSLHDGETDMALAGGVMLMLDSRLYASASGQGMLSPTGRCHSFDVEADGFVRAEGCGVVMLKRLDTPYQWKRTDAILKMKPVATEEGVIVGWHLSPEKTKRAGQFGGFHVLTKNGVVTKVGGGYTDALKKQIQTEGPDTYIGRIAEVEHQPPFTNDGKLRFPVFSRFRDPADVDPAVLEAYVNRKADSVVTDN
jgi:hypothetical protein